jgi:rod shape-determining protein MreC
MALASLGREPTPFFRQGPTAFSRWLVFSVLALALMVADTRFELMLPLRNALAVALYPLQWLAMRPVLLAESAQAALHTMTTNEATLDTLRQQLSTQGQRANRAEQLLLENRRLRDLLSLQVRLEQRTVAAQVLYDAADPYTRKVILDKGELQGLHLGAPVVDELGVLGQVTRLFPLMSEVTLITDRDHAIPVLNARTGARGVAYGDNFSHADAMELRFMAANADVEVGDLLTTSGVDGVYPAGLPVARIEKIERRTDAIFARIYCAPVASVAGAAHVLVIDPLNSEAKPRPATPPEAKTSKTGGRR